MEIGFENTPINDKSVTPEFLLQDALTKAKKGLIKGVVITAEIESKKDISVIVARSYMTNERACFMHRLSGWNLDRFLDREKVESPL